MFNMNKNSKIQNSNKNKYKTICITKNNDTKKKLDFKIS